MDITMQNFVGRPTDLIPKKLRTVLILTQHNLVLNSVVVCGSSGSIRNDDAMHRSILLAVARVYCRRVVRPHLRIPFSTCHFALCSVGKHVDDTHRAVTGNPPSIRSLDISRELKSKATDRHRRAVVEKRNKHETSGAIRHTRCSRRPRCSATQQR